jgi:hypothetical protein
MGTRLRLTLLMLTTLPDVMGPPNRPAGRKSKASHARTVPCDKWDGGQGILQNGNVYKCDECGKYFNYCTTDGQYFQDSEAAEHMHASG